MATWIYDVREFGAKRDGEANDTAAAQQAIDAMHEYYEPETDEPILGRGVQNWNMLTINTIAWLERREVVEEF